MAVFEETVRRHLTSVAVVAYIVLLMIMGFGVARFDSPGSVWPQFVGLLTYILGCTPIGPEFSSGTLQLILVKPVNRSAYLISRVAGVVAVLWIAALAAATAEVLGRLAWGENVALADIGIRLLNTASVVVITVVLLTMFGSFLRSYLNIALYFVLQIALSMSIGLLGLFRQQGGAVGRFIEAHPEIVQTIDRILNNLFPEAPQVMDGPWLLLVYSNAAVALVAACLFFRKREVPYGAD